MNTDSDLYQDIAKIHAQRKASQVWNSQQVERYVEDNFYAFSRGEFLVALTNTSNDKDAKVTYHPFNEGDTVCNVFFPTTDCQVVNGGVDIFLKGGESKIYVPQSKLATVEDISPRSFLQ